MKALLCYLALAICCSADLDSLSIGEPCILNSPFTVSSFIVVPYPPVLEKQYNINIAGTFIQNEYISNIATRISHDSGI